MPRLEDYIDEDEPFGLDEDKQNKCLCGSGVVGLACFITFCILISEQKNLLPNDQVVFISGSQRSAINGPGVQRVPVTGRKVWRKALLLDGTQWATVRNVRTNIFTMKEGPRYEFLDAYEDFVRMGNKTLIGRDEFVRIINIYNGQERIVTGPTAFAPDVADQGVRTHIAVEKAMMLTKDMGIVIRDRQTAEMKLVTTCDEEPGPFFPSPKRDIIETRERVQVPPHEAVLVQDVDGRTEIMSGANPPENISGNCGNKSVAGALSGGGLAFFLPPQSRIVRMKWSDYSKPQEKAMNLTRNPLTTMSATRRRRTSRNRIVLAQDWNNTPTTWLVAGDYDVQTKLWGNRGSGRNITNVVRKGVVTVASTAANAPTARILALVGAAGTHLEFGNILTGGKWTLCSLARYTGGAKRSIIAGPGNWAHGHYKGFSGVARYGYLTTDLLSDNVRPDTEWVPICGTSGDAPDNVVVNGVALGVGPGNATSNPKETTKMKSPSRPSRVYVNGDASTSDFALAELIAWNKELSKRAIEDVMDYFRARLVDASTYIDQAASEEQAMSDVPRKDVIGIDLRTQKSFYKFQVRTSDNVRMVAEGTIFWKVVAPDAMVSATSDPEGDTWSKSRSIILDAVSSVTFREFLTNNSEIIVRAYEDNRNSTFWTERGLELVSLEMTHFDPLDARTRADLRSIVAQKVQRIIKLTKQTSESEIRKITIAADIALEGNRTTLIEVKATNDRLEAETRGATEGQRKARGVAAFIAGLSSVFPSTLQPVELYEHYLVLTSMGRQAKALFNGKASVFIKPKASNLSLLLPADVEPARRLSFDDEDDPEMPEIPLMLAPPTVVSQDSQECEGGGGSL